jgi:hypothetical protein
VNQNFVVWSEDSVVYVYDLKDYMKAIVPTASFMVSSVSCDICSTTESGFLFIAFPNVVDCVPLPIPQARLTVT